MSGSAIPAKHKPSADRFIVAHIGSLPGDDSRENPIQTSAQAYQHVLRGGLDKRVFLAKVLSKAALQKEGLMDLAKSSAENLKKALIFAMKENDLALLNNLLGGEFYKPEAFADGECGEIFKAHRKPSWSRLAREKNWTNLELFLSIPLYQKDDEPPKAPVIMCDGSSDEEGVLSSPGMNSSVGSVSIASPGSPLLYPSVSPRDVFTNPEVPTGGLKRSRTCVGFAVVFAGFVHPELAETNSEGAVADRVADEEALGSFVPIFL